MIKLNIDNQNIEVAQGESVLDAATKLGIEIPTMCFGDKSFGNHPSCMVCVVKDAKTGKLFPSCAMPAQEGMQIVSSDDQVKEARREALELLLSDHVGDCEAPCRPSCPAFMDIPKMNRLIAEEKFAEAHSVVKEDIALPLILGYICPAPCEKACRRNSVDEAISICHLKQFVAAEDFDATNNFLPKKKTNTGKRIAIIGSGPAGLSAAFYALRQGHNCDVYDKNEKIGGALAYEILEIQLPKLALQQEVDLIKTYGANFIMGTEITKERFENEIKPNYDAIILATGNYFGSKVEDFGFDAGKSGIQIDKDNYTINNQGVFACGNIVRERRMSINSVAQGKIAALSADQFLRGQKVEKPARKFNSKFGKLYSSEVAEYLKECLDDLGESINERQISPQGKLGILTKEQAVIEAKRCLHCDCRALDDCKLRDLSDLYDAKQNHFAFAERKTIKKYFTHKSIVFEPEKCIKCNLCVEIAQREGEEIGFTTVGRGFDVEIRVPFNKSISEALKTAAIKCAIACPTGALSEK